MLPRSRSPWLHFRTRGSTRARLVHPPFQLPSALGILRTGPALSLPRQQCRVLLTLHSQRGDRKCCSRRPSPNSLNMASATTTQTRKHSGHSHHHHHHDNAYLTSTNKNDAGVRITRIGLYVNLAMAIGKGIGGYVFHSQGNSIWGCTS